MRAVLENQLRGRPIHCPFKLGTAAAGAYFSGCDEGRVIAKEIDTITRNYDHG
jgi:hypothetical protein